LDREHVQKLLFGEAKSHPYRGLVGWVPKTKDSLFLQPKPRLSRIRRLQHMLVHASPRKQNNPTAKPKAIPESFAKHMHVFVCKSTQSEQPIHKLEAILALQAEQPNRQTQSHSGKLRKTYTRLTQVTNSKPYYHCKQNNPTAKPKAILESFAKHIHVCVCRSTQAEQPK
jgi:hypothetical protein